MSILTPPPNYGLCLAAVRIQDFRALRDLTIDLDRETTVLVGENNSGKTSLLDALAVALGQRRPRLEDLHDGPTGKANGFEIDLRVEPMAGNDFADPIRDIIGNGIQLEAPEFFTLRVTGTVGAEGWDITLARTFVKGWARTRADAGMLEELKTPMVGRQALQLLHFDMLDARRDIVEQLRNRRTYWGRATLSQIGGQRIVSTHSTHVASIADVHAYRLFRRQGAEVTVAQVDAAPAKLWSTERTRHWVQVQNPEMLFAKVVGIVEGRTEADAFRCATSITKLANSLMTRHPGRLRNRVMEAATSAPGGVRAVAYPDESAEARGVLDWIQLLLQDGLDPSYLLPAEETVVQPEDICVLCRNRYSLDHVIREFDSRNIEYLFSVGRRGLVETAEANLVIHGLKLLQNPSDRVTRESILAEWSNDLLDSGAAELPILQFFDELSRHVPALKDLAAVFHDGVDTEIGELTRQILNRLSEAASEPAIRDDEHRAALLTGDLKTLRDRWAAYSGQVAPEGRSLGGFLGELALAGRNVIEGPGVRVLTVHAAKGLEFRAVALVGMNEGTLPDYRNLRTNLDIADEMRIAYVAITRASRALLVTRPKIRLMPWGDRKVQAESRFIRQMGLQMET